MTYKNKRRWLLVRDYCIGWTSAFVLLCIVRGVGTVEEGSVQFEFWNSILISIFFGIFFGGISGYAQVLTEERIYKRTSIQKLLVLRFLYSMLFLITLILLAYVICRTFFGITIGLIQFAFEPGSFAIYFYILLTDFFMVVLRQVNLMLGKNNLGKLLGGKFYTPREEERIFMFLDLQSSTQLAEKLGHIKYSMLLQDCFNDLGVVMENEAEIYQYVGDEAILTWPLQDGLRKQNCIRAYFSFKKRLSEKKDYYLETYGSIPFFKAGLNTGVVTVTEVGRYKKEIAYHGDTLNTAARIQAKCNHFEKELLISGYLKEKLNGSGLEYTLMGSEPLRGKQKEVEIYAIAY